MYGTIIKIAAATLLIGGIWYAIHHYGATQFEAGANSIKKADAAALDEKQKADAKRNVCVQ